MFVSTCVIKWKTPTVTKSTDLAVDLLFWLTNLLPTVLTGLSTVFLLTRFINYDCETLTDFKITETEN